MTETQLYLDGIQLRLNVLMSESKKRSILKTLEELFNTALNSNYNISLNQVYNIVAGVFNTAPEYFMRKIYKSFNKLITNLLSDEKILELEKYVLKLISLLPDEEFISIFPGKLIQNDSQVKGRIYLTNYRVLALGKWGATALSMFGAAAIGSSTGSGGSNVAVFMGINAYIQEHLQANLQKVMRNDVSLDKPCFGYQYPILKVFKIVRTSNNVKYRTVIRYHKGGKLKRKRLNIKIFPKKLVNETENEFNNRRVELLYSIEQRLKQGAV